MLALCSLFNQVKGVFGETALSLVPHIADAAIKPSSLLAEWAFLDFASCKLTWQL